MARIDEIRANVKHDAEMDSETFRLCVAAVAAMACSDRQYLLERVERLERVAKAARKGNARSEGTCNCDACVAIREFDALEADDGE